MKILSQLIFSLAILSCAYLFFKRVSTIRRNILLGKDIHRKDSPGNRWKKMLLVAFGQRKMFKRPIPAFLHLFVYVGFLIINIEIVEIVLDGLLGTHRLLLPLMGASYATFISLFEFLAFSVIVSCVIFLFRRYWVKVRRFTAYELTQPRRTDASIILFTEIALMTAFLIMNAADQVLQARGVPGYMPTGSFTFSQFLMPMLDGYGNGMLIFIERYAWWFHIIGVFAFLIYIPISKHLHIFLAFPNTYYSNLEPKGKIRNMPEITKEVQLMMNPDAAASEEPPAEPARFGAKDVTDLHWKNLLDAYTCTECGRCTDSCPANITGKKLSPRKIVMDTRYRMEELGHHLDKNKGTDTQDGKSLLHDWISKEEILACTNCNACVEACPVNIDPLDIINQLKRYVTMEEASSPQEWNIMFGNVENNGAPWAFPQSDRIKWAEELKSESGESNNQ